MQSVVPGADVYLILNFNYSVACFQKRFLFRFYRRAVVIAIIAYSRVLFLAGRLSLEKAPVLIKYKRERKRYISYTSTWQNIWFWNTREDNPKGAIFIFP